MPWYPHWLPPTFIPGDCIPEKAGGAGLIAKGGRFDMKGLAAGVAALSLLPLRDFLAGGAVTVMLSAIGKG